MKFIVTQIEGGVDRLEGLKINIYALFLAFVGDYCAAVNDEAVLGALVIELEALLRRSDGAENRKTVDARFDVGRRAVLVRKHFLDPTDLVAGWDNEGDHRRPISPRGLQILNQLLNLEDLDLRV